MKRISYENFQFSTKIALKMSFRVEFLYFLVKLYNIIELNYII